MVMGARDHFCPLRASLALPLEGTPLMREGLVALGGRAGSAVTSYKGGRFYF